MTRAQVMRRKRRRRIALKFIKLTIFVAAVTAAYHLFWIPYCSFVFDAESSNQTGLHNSAGKRSPVKKNSNSTPETNKPRGNSRYLILINKDHLLPTDYKVPQVSLGRNNKYVSENKSVSDIIYKPLMRMLEDGEASGLSFRIVSGYRSISYQDNLIRRQMNELMSTQALSEEEAYTEATRVIMPSRSSEHCSGLAVDIAAASYPDLEEDQEQTAENKWLLKNCWKYGFILRYPKDKEDITGIIYEPWHFRYVENVEVARYIMEHNLTLEEYLEL